MRFYSSPKLNNSETLGVDPKAPFKGGGFKGLKGGFEGLKGLKGGFKGLKGLKGLKGGLQGLEGGLQGRGLNVRNNWSYSTLI